MDNFIDKYNETNGASPISWDRNKVLGPFIGTPNNLSLSQKQELVYRFQFLDESIPTLARAYRLTPIALQEWIDEHEYEIVRIETPEDLANFEAHVEETYKDLKTRMTGLMALHSAVAWDSLQRTSEHLLASLELASHRLRGMAEEGYVDVKEVKTLVDAFNKVLDKHVLLKNAAGKDDKAEGLQKTLEDLLNEINGSSYKLPSEEAGGSE